MKLTKKSAGLALGVIQSFVALGAIPAGLSMVIAPDGSGIGMPQSLLYDSPFNSYLIPGIVLFVVNGLFNIAGAVYSFSRARFFGFIAIFLGGSLIIWICVQVYFIGMMYFLQPFMLAVGILETALGIAARKY